MDPFQHRGKKTPMIKLKNLWVLSKLIISLDPFNHL